MNLATLPDVIGKNGLFIDGDWVESKDQDPQGDVRLIQLADIGDGEFLDKSSRFMTSEKAAKLRCTYLQAGDILVARMPDPVGRACVFPGDDKPCVTVVDVCIIRPDQTLADTRWLLHLINSATFRSKITSWVVGATRQRISRGNLSRLEFHLPKVDEQKRIAAILDKADAICRKRQQSIQLADEFLRSVFLDMFGDPRNNKKKLDHAPLGDLIKLRSGDFLPAVQMNSNGAFLVYGGNGVSGKHDHYMFEEPIIVIGRVGVYCGAVHVTEPRSWITDNALYVSEMSEKLNATYLEWALRVANLNQYANQAAQPLISGSRVNPVEILVPAEQDQALFDQISQRFVVTYARLNNSLLHAEKVFGSACQRAFRGEL